MAQEDALRRRALRYGRACAPGGVRRRCCRIRLHGIACLEHEDPQALRQHGACTAVGHGDRERDDADHRVERKGGDAEVHRSRRRLHVSHLALAVHHVAVAADPAAGVPEGSELEDPDGLRRDPDEPGLHPVASVRAAQGARVSARQPIDPQEVHVMKRPHRPCDRDRDARRRRLARAGCRRLCSCRRPGPRNDRQKLLRSPTAAAAVRALGLDDEEGSDDGGWPRRQGRSRHDRRRPPGRERRRTDPCARSRRREPAPTTAAVSLAAAPPTAGSAAPAPGTNAAAPHPLRSASTTDARAPGDPVERRRPAGRRGH